MGVKVYFRLLLCSMAIDRKPKGGPSAGNEPPTTCTVKPSWAALGSLAAPGSVLFCKQLPRITLPLGS